MSGETDEDPSSWTPDLLQQQVDRANRAERDWVIAQLAVRDARVVGLQESMDRRLTAIDKATVLFQETLIRVPTDVDKQVGNLKELLLTRFSSVDQRFVDGASRTTEDKRVAQEALVAALAAAKELVGKQNEFSAAAIDKSEVNTTKSIEKNRELAEATTAGISQQVSDLKELLTLWRADTANTINALRAEIAAITTARNAVQEQRVDTRASQASVIAVVGGLVGILVLALAIYAAVKAGQA